MSASEIKRDAIKLKNRVGSRYIGELSEVSSTQRLIVLKELDFVAIPLVSLWVMMFCIHSQGYV